MGGQYVPCGEPKDTCSPSLAIIPMAELDRPPSGSGFHSMAPIASVNLAKCSCTALGVFPRERMSTCEQIGANR